MTRWEFSLVERLRRRNPVTEPECHEAADTIAAQEKRIEELEDALNETEHELAHDRWASCGCLGGSGGLGHEEGSAECLADTASKGSVHGPGPSLVCGMACDSPWGPRCKCGGKCHLHSVEG